MTTHIDIFTKPVPKGRPRMTKTGHTYTPQDTVDAETLIRDFAKVSHASLETGPVFVRIRFTFKKPESNKTAEHAQRPDVDNCAKLVTDALNGISYKDDAQIVSLCATKLWGPKDRIEVWVEPIF